MIEEAIVHVGMPKTGSSSIQDTLSRLPMQGVEYLSLNSPNHSGFLMTVLSDNPHDYHSHASNGLSYKEVQELKKNYTQKLHYALENVDKPKILISAEDLSRPDGSISELKYFQQILLGYCKRVRVIGYVRPPIGYMQSAFQQRLKGGINFNLNLTSVYPNYYKRFSKIDTVFGRENVELVPFRSDSLYEGDAVLDFAHRIDVDLAPDQIVRTNESLSLEATSLLYVLRRLNKSAPYKKFNRDNGQFIAMLNNFGSQKLVFSASAVASFLEANRQDLDWISGRLGSSILDKPVVASQVIESENDLLNVAYANRLAIWQLFEQTVPLTQDSQGIAQLIDQLQILRAKNILPLKSPEHTLFNSNQLESIASSYNEPAVILNTLAYALAISGQHVTSQCVRDASKRAAKLVNKTRHSKTSQQLVQGSN
ncbi:MULTISPECIES: hypothetical protein [Halomonadaceae]|uniref:Sulfotransferase family protein n=1 Tax=Vreelandella sp. SM1641 TaxID=3126101 RepID=A0AAU7XQF2_9GAMM|nr:hypothetical protein [Halomonas sp. KO116]AJY51409.1 hypothetical protein KO116_02936 [Halomonas sp. KO116]